MNGMINPAYILPTKERTESTNIIHADFTFACQLQGHQIQKGIQVSRTKSKQRVSPKGEIVTFGLMIISLQKRLSVGQTPVRYWSFSVVGVCMREG